MNPTKNNPLKNRDDLKHAILDICKPLLPLFSESKSRIFIGVNTAHYSDEVAGVEAFCRPLWGLAPLFCDGSGDEFAEIYRKGLADGTNPSSPTYWGEPSDYDQLLVEMAAIGLALILAPEKIWEPLSDIEKDNLCNWLNFVNTKKACDNNWRLFAVMVNIGLKSVGRPYNREVTERALDFADKLYIGNGWYSDGVGLHCDYYVAFAIHYYSLNYAKVMQNDAPERCEKIKSRARRFALDFIEFFDNGGAAVAFGRSMTYRFAQSAFWSAYIFAEVGGIETGIIKGIILRNLRWWLKLPIWNNDGTLTVGYAYPNLVMAENYNTHGSPYWAFKSMLIAALPADSDFWECEELPLPKSDGLKVMPQSHLAVQRTESHSVLYSAGFNNVPWLTHCAEKYEKFAYSSRCGFNVPKSYANLSMSGGDNMLLLRDSGVCWQPKTEPVNCEFTNEWFCTEWQPFSGVTIKTYVIPLCEWHIRVHFINSERELEGCEGGFAVPSVDTFVNNDSAGAVFEENESKIVNLRGVRTPEIITAEPNTNLMYNRTVIPSLKGVVKAGESVLACGVFFGKNKTAVPVLSVGSDKITVTHGKITVAIPLSNS